MATLGDYLTEAIALRVAIIDGVHAQVPCVCDLEDVAQCVGPEVDLDTIRAAIADLVSLGLLVEEVVEVVEGGHSSPTWYVSDKQAEVMWLAGIKATVTAALTGEV